MRRKASALLVFGAVLFGAAGCDVATKQLALASLAGAGTVSLAGDLVRLELASNPGGFLSLGAHLPEALRQLFFVGLVPLLLLVLCAALLRRREASLPLVMGLGLFAGGGLANWLDRLLHGGAVTDFVTLGLGPLRTGVFNVADLAILAGVAALVLGMREAEGPAPRTPS